MAALFGRYEYVSELGRGTGSRVVKARDLADRGAPRALKIVGPEDGKRLAWELSRLSEIEHPNVAAVRELLRVEQAVHAPFALVRGAWVLVEDLANGQPADLALEPLKDDPRALLASVFRVAMACAEGLGALHRAGLVHGDVKPANVLCTASAKSLTLIDLGAARTPGFYPVIHGTPDYLAPEAWTGTCSFGQDVYALGATLFDLIQGEVGAPATGSSAPWRIRDVDALPARLPAAFRDVLRRMLSIDPESRPADAARLLALLHGLGRRLHLGVPRSAALYATGRVAPSARELAARALSAPFVGHEGLRDELARQLGQSGVVLVVGPAGAGRTRLIRESLRKMQLACVEHGRATPTLLSDLQTAERIEVAAATVHQVLCDAEHVERALRAVAAWSRSGRFLSVVLELEPSVVASTLGLPRFEVGPLDSEAERALLRSVLSADLPTETLQVAHEASGGYAGRLCVLVARGLGEGRALLRASEWSGLALDSSHLGQLGANALRLARLLSLGGASLPFDAVIRLIGSVAAAREARDELRACGLLFDDGEGSLRLQEDAGRRVRRELGDDARALARELSLAWSDEPLPTWVCVFQDEPSDAQNALLDAAARARNDGDPRAVVALLQEGLLTLDREPLRLALADAQRALGDYQAARTTLAPCVGAAAQLLNAEVTRLAGDSAAAAARLDALCATSEGSTREMAEALLARAAYDLGDLARATALVEVLPGERSARLRAREVRVLLALGRADPGDGEAAHLLSEARQSGDARSVSRALLLASRVSLLAGLPDRAKDELRAALARSREAGEAHEAATIATNLGLLELDAGDLGPALSTLRSSLAALVWLGRDADMARALYNLGNAALLIGDLPLAETTLAEARGRSRPHEDPALDACLAMGEADLALHRGALDEAHAGLSAELELQQGGTASLLCVLASRAACTAIASSRFDAADRALEIAERTLAPADPTQAAELCVARVRSLLARGEVHAAEDQAQRGGELAARVPYETRLRLLFAGIDAARANGLTVRAEERALQCRMLIERALASLEPDARALFRSLPAHARALSQAAPVSATRASTAGASRELLLASRRLFEATSEARLARAAAQIGLELVQAERALVVVQAVDGTASVLGSATLGADEALPYSRSIVERVWADMSLLVAVDAQHDARLDAAQSVHSLGVRSVIAVPLRAFGGRAALYLDDRLRPAAFGSHERQLLSDLAELVAAASRVVSSLRRERLAARQAQHEVRALESKLAQRELPIAGAPLIGESRALMNALHLARRVARSNSPVLVQGESGTGKELLARFIHTESERHAGPFVAESCAALPEGLLESALFGHERGAFTGADRARLGLFETAHTGTLFLDEVAEMSPALQAKLLRVLQDGEVRPVGSDKTRHVDVRVVSATHRDLAALVQARQFREDLFYRLAVVSVELPPLRDRLEDVPLLVSHFLMRHANRKDARITPQALQALQNRAWPGNVRQLESEIQRALALSDGVIEVEHLSVTQLEPAPLGLDLRSHTDAVQRQLVRRALNETSGNQTRAADLLGISRFGLQKMLKRLGID